MALAFSAMLSACGGGGNSTTTTTATESAPTNSLQLMADDMALPHEERPHGVPDSINWAVHPRLNMANNPGQFSAFTAWGQVYEAASGNPATNTRVHIRTMRAFLLSRRDGAWHRVQEASSFWGGAYLETYANDTSKSADIRTEPEGGISVKPGNGWNFQFGPSSKRIGIDPADIAGVLVSIEARCVVDDPKQPDDIDRARFLVGAGADYWLDMTAKWDDYKTNGDVGIGRLKYATREFRTYNMTSLSLAQLQKNPPPLQ